jgi:hypothetical protein
VDDSAAIAVIDEGIRDAREHLARWLAAAVLLADPVALEDGMLAERLLVLQGRIEEMTCERYTA